MKKIFYTVVSLTMIMLTMACTNDEIQVDKVGRLYTLSLNVGTQSMYDKFGITNFVRENFLRSNSRSIGVFVYIYDDKGDLVVDKQTTLLNMNTTSLSFDNLIEGKYTVVTVETLVNSDVNNESDVWSIDDSKCLSTLKITEKLDEEPDDDGYRWTKTAYAGNAIGVDIRNITLEKNEAFEIEPAPIGSIVNFHVYNFENSTYPYTAYTTQDILDYYSLNPAISRDQKYTKNLTASSRTNVRAWHDSVEDVDSYTLTYILEKDFEWAPCVQTQEQVILGQVTSLSDLGSSEKLEDGKVYEIGFYYLGNNMAATYFGDRNGLAEWIKECEINTVQNNDFKVPYTNWSVGTVSAVKSYMSNYILIQEPTLSSTSNKYEMIYFDSSQNMYEYHFTTSTSGLTDAYVYLDGGTYTIADVRKIVEQQGYTYNSHNNNNYYYTGTNTYVTVYQANSGTILVNYYDPKAYGLSPKRELPSFKEVMASPLLCKQAWNLRKADVEARIVRPFNFSFEADMIKLK